jgi:hypothetical protein
MKCRRETTDSAAYHHDAKSRIASRLFGQIHRRTLSAALAPPREKVGFSACGGFRFDFDRANVTASGRAHQAIGVSSRPSGFERRGHGRFD